MKIFAKRNISLFLVLALLVPIIWNQNVTVASAATPALTMTKVELAGTGETYDLNINNKVKGSKYTWTTSNPSVATVTKSGLITSVGAGTATIRCKITYPSKKTKSLSCKVTVTIPATEISISSPTLVNGAYQMLLGSTIDFNTVFAPENSTDKTYWYIDNGDPECISIDDAVEGKITAKKAGKVSVKVRAAKEATQEAAAVSTIDDAVIIEVVAPTATVKSSEITNTNEVTVIFDSPVQQNTVIGANKALSDNITIIPLKNTKSVLANDPGALTANLSTDLKTLTITSVNKFEGEYQINFTKNILTTSGVAIDDYIKKMTYTDVYPPYILSVTTDDTGVKATINFSEVIDFSSFKVVDAQAVSSTIDVNTRSILSMTSNYIISTDKKSVTIDLSNISSADFNKSYVVTLSGIKDLNGNIPANAYLLANLYTDKSAKPQAQLLTVERTSYNTITATFDRAISFGGYITIDNGGYIVGSVDNADKKKVNYTIASETELRYTGARNVTVSSWNGYNVAASETTGKPVTRSVYFNVDTVPPVLTKYVYDAATGILTLTYSEAVNLSTISGIFTARLVSPTGVVSSGKNITYTVVAHTDGNNIIKLKLANMDTFGYYSFDTYQGFVTDNFKNQNAVTTVSINTSNGSTELPGPYMVRQSDTNPSQIYLDFINMLDLTSAQNVSNYSITGVAIVSAVVTNNNTNGATVVLTVMDGAIDASVERQLKITGVMGYNGSYSAITSYTKFVELKDNKKPYFNEQAIFDTSARNIIRLNFSETIKGSLIVNVYQMSGSTSVPISNTVTISGSTASINLGTYPTNGTYLKIEIVSNYLTDMSGNAVTFNSSTYGVGVTY